jgi:DmsE family decaheme c-type cytochrome
MKGFAMKTRRLFSIFIVLFVALVVTSLALGQQNKFKLKPGAAGKLCLECHADFEEKLKTGNIHTPVKMGECTGCHDPHAASHGKLISADTNKICFSCHKTIIPENAKSTHKVVVEGNCVKCHDPHASSNTKHLIKAGNEICFQCHKEKAEQVTKAQFKHFAVEKGCINCHSPHASLTAPYDLRNTVPALCLGCHKTDKPGFASKHMNYPVANAKCTSCHNPHGSDKAGILYNNVHEPVVNRMCNQCHEAPTSTTPFKVKKTGNDLCRGCHAQMMNETLNKNMVHAPLLDSKGCMNCHDPHASPVKGLLQGSALRVCGACHADTVERQRNSKTKHEPVFAGNCAACHNAHASDTPVLFNNPSIVEVCGTCHDWQKHSTHPIGEKYVDMRNKNLYVQCLTCHRAHGSDFKAMLPYATQNDLCVQCHKKFTR